MKFNFRKPTRELIYYFMIVNNVCSQIFLEKIATFRSQECI